MEFTLAELNDMEEGFREAVDDFCKTIKIRKMEEKSLAMLQKQNKDTLIRFVENFGDLVKRNVQLLKLAAAKIDEQKSELLLNQKNQIGRQQQLI